MIDRRTGIGASEVYDVVEGDRLKVWRSKVEGYQEKDVPHLWRGRRLERTVLEMYQEKLQAEGDDELAIPEPQETTRHSTSQVLFATPDAFILADGEDPVVTAVVDAKTSATWRGWGEEGTAEVPNRILFQVIAQMACCDMDEGHVAALMPSHELRVYKILRDRETEGRLIEKVEQFWKDYVVTKKPPLEFIDHSDGWMEWLNQRYPQETKEHLIATIDSDLSLQCCALKMIQEKKKELQAQEDTTKNILRHLLGEHSGVTGEFGRIDYKKTKDGSKTDWKGIVEALMEERAGLHNSNETVADLVKVYLKLHTTDKPGVRSLHPYWKGSREE